jgi:hypothetical protein
MKFQQIILAIGLALFVNPVFAQGTIDEKMIDMETVQYFAVHKVDYSGINHWDVAYPSTFNQTDIDEIMEKTGTKGTPKRLLAVAHTFSYLRYPIENTKESIRRMLQLSVENDIPVILHLDGVNWWSFRADLWNFWEKNAAGFHPDNINNVERYGWEMETAVKIGWRNWGSQIRVNPAPNLASPTFLKAQREALDILLPLIADWYDHLPKNKKYLLGGIVFGWELSTFTQAYYYEGGNELLGSDPKNDPKSGVENSIALGYAAASTLGLQSEGVISEETQDAICMFYLNFLIDIALKHGIHPRKIITHAMRGGNPGKGGGQSGMASITAGVEGVIPGWSWYDTNLEWIDTTLLAKLKKMEWAAIEVKPWDLSAQIFTDLFNLKGCRYINIFNWESIRNDEKTINAIKTVLR